MSPSLKSWAFDTLEPSESPLLRFLPRVERAGGTYCFFRAGGLIFTMVAMLSHSLRSSLRNVGALNHCIRKINFTVPGRTGALAMKAGMISEFDNNGHRNEEGILSLSWEDHFLHSLIKVNRAKQRQYP